MLTLTWGIGSAPVPIVKGLLDQRILDGSSPRWSSVCTAESREVKTVSG